MPTAQPTLGTSTDLSCFFTHLGSLGSRDQKPQMELKPLGGRRAPGSHRGVRLHPAEFGSRTGGTYTSWSEDWGCHTGREDGELDLTGPLQ